MVMTLAIPMRKFYGLEDFITMRHLDNMAKVMLATGLIVAYGYMMETFGAFYSGNQYEKFMVLNRWFGPYAFFYWLLIACNIVLPQLMWLKKVRMNVLVLFVISLIVNMRDVAGAIHYRGDEFASRFSAVVVGNVLPDEMGLGDVLGNDWIIPDAAIFVHSIFAGDFDFGNAHAG